MINVPRFRVTNCLYRQDKTLCAVKQNRTYVPPRLFKFLQNLTVSCNRRHYYDEMCLRTVLFYVSSHGSSESPIGNYNKNRHSRNNLWLPENTLWMIASYNSIQEEIKIRLKSRNACYHSVQNLLSPCAIQNCKD